MNFCGWDFHFQLSQERTLPPCGNTSNRSYCRAGWRGTPVGGGTGSWRCHTSSRTTPGTLAEHWLRLHVHDHLLAAAIEEHIIVLRRETEFRQDLPEIQEFRADSPETQLPRIKTGSLQSSGVIDDDGGNGVIPAEDREEEEGCRTPKSPRNFLPETLVCPPAPKKPRRAAPSCKRKLGDELQFFEVVGRDEIDSFFRRVHDRNFVDSGGSNKRSRTAKP
nr:cyclin-dependent protein kinase inhibitor SMR2-like [Ipomoea batatas]